MEHNQSNFGLDQCHDCGVRRKQVANPTTNFNFVMPTPTDLVTDLPADFEVFGQAVDTQLATLTTKIAFNNQTGTTYTLAAGDLAKWVTCSNGSPITVTVPPSVFVAGNVINLQRIGSGSVTFAQGAGVTITSTGATASAPKLRAQYSACSIVCTASNTFTIVGDLS
jgi:hypothetical protein